MNYANMIEDKNLKKTFIIATLVSTLVGTFAASHNLYDRLTQKKKDENQDGSIKKLEEKLDQMATLKEDGSKKKDDLKDELDTSRWLIKREYDGAYARLGGRFATGDILTENELQKQIILLQQTVIGVLEDALYNGRQIGRGGVDKLVRASRSARNGSLDALQGQYRRILQELPVSRPPPKAIEAGAGEASPRGPLPPRPPPKAHQASSKTKTRPGPSSRSPPRGTSGRDFYCRYSVDLQLSPRPLSGAFAPGKGSACPACSTRLTVDTADMWEFTLPARASSVGATAGKSSSRDKAKAQGRDTSRKGSAAKGQHVQGMVRIRLPAKFVVKCHTPEGEYACALCCGPDGEYGGEIVLCEDPEALVDHVAKEHKTSDLEKEVDIIIG